MIDADTTAGVTFPALGSTAALVVTEPALLSAAHNLLTTELAAMDLAASRFRPDSELSQLHRGAGSPMTVSPLLAEALAVALRAARLTNGIVDPTVGRAVIALGYDRDFAELVDTLAPAGPATPAPGWWRVLLDGRQVVLPRGVELDLGATAKALAADRAALRIAAELGCGVLVSLGGDVSVAGPTPDGGWRVGVGDDHRMATTEPDTTVTIRSGGLATSSTSVRTWRRAGRAVHHIVDPRTGDVPEPAWRTVSVAARSGVDANTASTAAIVLGAAATDWLTETGLPARLVAEHTGAVLTLNGWPE
jgi:FAD:protein FMN transferase